MLTIEVSYVIFPRYMVGDFHRIMLVYIFNPELLNTDYSGLHEISTTT